MSPSEHFPLFAKLPPELRILIWKMSILEHNRDRLVPYNRRTKRIVCIRSLECSSHFRATLESRQVATELYPIRLPVSFTLYLIRPEDGEHLAIDDYVDTDPQGAIYISTYHDIFVFDTRWHVTSLHCLPYWLTGHLAWRSPRLPQSQCQSIRQVMLYHVYPRDQVREGCRYTLECIAHYSAMGLHEEGYDTKLFSGVQTVLYAILDPDVAHHCAHLMLHMTGHRVLEYLRDRGHIARLDYLTSENFQTIREGSYSTECICITKTRDSVMDT
ncbi:hypothetical protein F4678DRAFT_410528 [Xylaria arbuscula]|nr:hypothetical protein F4678DRAFT_410528 [Xylaria arbuscula]